MFSFVSSHPRIAGDTLNLVNVGDEDISPTGKLAISSKSDIIVIHHPDLLLTATSISNAPQCRRKPLLSQLVRSSSDITPALVWGNMLHEVMQTCMAAGRWDEAFMDEQIDSVIRKNLAELVKIGLSVADARREVKARSKGLHVFSERYISSTPKPDAVLADTRATPQESASLAVSELHDVEEDIWSPTYGLKGKLDATVQAVIAEKKVAPSSQSRSATSAGASASQTTTTHVMPFEIKTGRANAGLEHRAQTMLYTLLAAERYASDVPAGLLYYTQAEEVVRVPRSRNELRGLIVARNELAAWMMKRSGGKEVKEGERFLPETIDDKRVCGRCYVLDSCMLYRRAVENVEDDASPIADMYKLKTDHLTQDQADFFRKWEALISLEEQDLVRFRKELWTMNAREREEKGRCFHSMVVDHSYRPAVEVDAEPDAPSSGHKIHRFTYRFVRSPSAAANAETKERSLLNGHMAVGDATTVSIEPHLLALARGFILSLSPHDVVLGVDHELSPEKLHLRHAGEVAAGSAKPDADAPLVFRIDKDEMFGGMGRIRDNLSRLFYASGAGNDERRLRLVVDLARPTFQDKADVRKLLQDDATCARVMGGLNASQMGAMTRVLSADDYALILGMPGTGKTTVIAALIRVLVAAGKTVLLTSYTHSAVDTILRKLRDAEFGILRLGNVDKVHPDIRHFTLADRRIPTTIEQLEHQIMSPPVVATTCLTIDHSSSSKGGLETSLFRRLSDAHPHAVVDLTHQYRMNEDIMLLSNTLIYSNRLKCGSEEVAKRSLVLPDRSFLEHELHGVGSSCQTESCWIEHLLTESCKAVFVDTDAIPALDSRVGDLVQNDIEASLVFQLTEALLKSGIREQQIGVMTLYRQQIKLLSYLLHDHPAIDVLTADKSQGRDKDCIIISMVRSNGAGHIGDLLKDWRRLNVSFTRAQSKLVIIGSRKTLAGTPLLQEFFVLMESQKWIHALQPGAHEVHPQLAPTRTSFPRSPGKRPAPAASSSSSSDAPNDTSERENVDASPSPKRSRAKITYASEGVLKGRPILKDLVNGEK
ncbi:Dna2-domain-containing protein [Coniophora puteana RWD-64-598 SS2]|uniref:DNA replication ATP-dependent helicase/nuclease n=1 Tax=Coniophora puteana (strain RWD-64-598) TaxID=741705 RepID=A0A5M3MN35_CONPW|nr:Dna2-domain-containing protein [Coniophora puteana RWD-64-598 SS2]EIW80184.1 Dna2-domain-containing protein [Coniophora puteana RWD-64-598 SS2]